MSAQARDTWVRYLRVSTPEQAAKDLSLPAQREAVTEYARRSGQEIAREYLESGCSGTDINRKAFRQMLEDVLRPGSDIGTIVVHHTSRFTRNATQARVVKEQLRKKGVKVVSVCQELNDDPIGQLIEGIFECIDQYESEVNGMRTAAAMREAVRQGFFPGAIPPYGFKAEKVEVRPGLVRSVLVVNHDEAAVVRELFRLYVANNGAKSVARTLNQRGSLYRNGKPWSKDLVLRVLEEPAIAGTYWWGKREPKTRRKKDPSEWLPLKVDSIVDSGLHSLAQRLRDQREPSRNPGQSPPAPMLLRGLVECAKCKGSYTLESSGKRVNGEVYTYRYYNCRTSCRVGKEACEGGRIPAETLDNAVLEFIAAIVCTKERCSFLLACRQSSRRPPTAAPQPIAEGTIESFREAWSATIREDPVVARNYLFQLIERIEVDENRIFVIPKDRFRTVA